MSGEFRMVRLPMDLADRIDEVRGGVPRERWVREALEHHLAHFFTLPGATESQGSEQAAGSGSSRRPPNGAASPPTEIPLPKIAKRR